MRSKSTLVLALSAALTLVACGGDDDDSPPAATQGPRTSDTASVDAFIPYVKRLVVVTDETLEPFDTSAVEPPLSEVIEPTTVD